MNRWLINLRTWTRRFGLNRLVNVVRPSDNYEERFCADIMAQVKPSDTVWDIGANVGFYTALFKDSIGPDGQVVAFEPAPACYDALLRRFAGCNHVRVENVAVGAENAEGTLVVGPGYSTTNEMIPSTTVICNAENSVTVCIVSCDSYWKSIGRTPNVIKIDVEGFEEEVVNGMSELLTSPQLRAVFVEVHFGLFQQRGRPHGPVAIENTLRGQGYRTRWIDWSHLQAIRS